MSTPDQLQVICVCGGIGFPFGNASAARITMVGKALQEAGVAMQVLHCGPSPIAMNTEPSGVHQGIPFRYTTSVRRPENRIARAAVYVRAALGLTLGLMRERPARRSRVVYLYMMDTALGLYAGALCRLLGLPVVQELCEWFPGDPDCSRFVRWLHRKPMFQLATGVLTISRFTEERALEFKQARKPGLVICRVPALTDTRALPAVVETEGRGTPDLVYCGTWLTDVSFVLRAFVRVKAAGRRCRLKLVGGALSAFAPQILREAAEYGIPPGEIAFTGWLDDESLHRCYATAAALLVPLGYDERSLARMPNKLPEYLASGRPVVSSNVGEVRELLTDAVSAYLAKPEDEGDFAAKIVSVLEDPEAAARVGAAARETAASRLDYRAHAGELARFFRECRIRGKQWNVRRFLRNSACGLFACALIALGFVRRAKRRAFSGDVITAAYFHKPDRELFAGLIEWFDKNGYVFVSAGDVLRFMRGEAKPPRGAVWLSFDDGCRELLTNVLPVTGPRKIPVTLFIPSGIVEGDGRFPWLEACGAERHALTLAELKAIAQCPGVDIGAHTVNHTVTAGLPRDRLRFELNECRQSLEDWTGNRVRHFAYPVGRCDGREQPLLAELGYELAFTTENDWITAASNPYQAPRFSVADEIWLPEAICNVVGVWRPAIDPAIRFLRRLRRALSRGGPGYWIAPQSTCED